MNRFLLGIGLLLALPLFIVIMLIGSASAPLPLTDSTPNLGPSVVTYTETPTNTFTSTPTNTPNPCAPAWSVVSSSNPGASENHLGPVTAVSANDVWAVGNYCSGNCIVSSSQTLVEHWNGSAWSVVSSPNVGTLNNGLLGVAAVSANNVWVVGFYNNGGSTAETLIEHWNGTAWSVVSSPSPGTNTNYLYGVAAVSANDVWAVGRYDNNSAPVHTLVEHWNGTSWSVVPSLNPGTGQNFLYRVAAVTATDVWAIGYYYNGSGPSQTLVEHWDGTSWAVVSSPNVGTRHNYLNGVAAVSANNVWAVGEYCSGSCMGFGPYQTLVEHWNGTSWSVVSSPNVDTADNILSGVAAVSSNDVWAVGHYLDSINQTYQTLIEHWNSTSWSVLSSPNVGTSHNYLNGVAAVSANNVWAVGYSGNASDTVQTLVEHYAAPCGTPTATPGPIIVGHVTWQGPPAQPDRRQQLPITLTLKLGITEVNYPNQDTDSSGFFTMSVTGLPNGTYNWRVKGPKYLANAGTVQLTGAAVTNTQMGMMRAGDANNDNLVTIYDFSILKPAFGRSVGQPGYDDRADFTGDQLVSAPDFNLLKANLGLSGAPPIDPHGE